jgi:hypothetical protein
MFEVMRLPAVVKAKGYSRSQIWLEDTRENLSTVGSLRGGDRCRALRR